MRYPVYIMEFLRQREGLDENDSSQDEELNKLTPKEAFKDVCNWHGFTGGWDSVFKMWIEDIYEINVDDHICVSPEDEGRF